MTLDELNSIYEETKRIYNSSISDQAKYNLIFGAVNSSYSLMGRYLDLSNYDPKYFSYTIIIDEFMQKFNEYMGNS